MGGFLKFYNEDAAIEFGEVGNMLNIDAELLDETICIRVQLGKESIVELIEFLEKKLDEID